MGGTGLRVLIDADVLFSRTLRDWLLIMSDAVDEHAIYTACWTEDVLAETVARIRDRRPDIDSHELEVIGDRLRTIWSSSQISGFAADRATFIGQDEGDLHVHSAAIAGEIDIVVTNDRRGLLPPDDRQDELDRLPYEVYGVDEFLLLVADQSPTVVRDCARRQLKHYLTRGGQVPNLVEKLQHAGAPDFAEKVRWVLQDIDLTDLDC